MPARIAERFSQRLKAWNFIKLLDMLVRLTINTEIYFKHDYFKCSQHFICLCSSISTINTEYSNSGKLYLKSSLNISTSTRFLQCCTIVFLAFNTHMTLLQCTVKYYCIMNLTHLPHILTIHPSGPGSLSLLRI